MKLTHPQAGYTHGNPHYCRECKYFQRSSSIEQLLRDGTSGPHCQLVQDPIRPSGWCKLFTAK